MCNLVNDFIPMGQKIIHQDAKNPEMRPNETDAYNDFVTIHSVEDWEKRSLQGLQPPVTAGLFIQKTATINQISR